MAKWIRFDKQPRKADRKTDTWAVSPLDGGEPLGQVAFFGAWRKFAFFPFEGTLYEADCLRDIAQFCEDQTNEWRDAKHPRKELPCGCMSPSRPGDLVCPHHRRPAGDR